ncbi:hypothetical protein MA1_01760 [Rickettsia prowazekii str. BuV67-CWPP]|nr:hypothetical protein MA1_01760 [Rickettsia prowazekii str. BuV67-CWPP]
MQHAPDLVHSKDLTFVLRVDNEDIYVNYFT